MEYSESRYWVQKLVDGKWRPMSGWGLNKMHAFQEIVAKARLLPTGEMRIFDVEDQKVVAWVKWDESIEV